jgi:hypothetical protein
MKTRLGRVSHWALAVAALALFAAQRGIASVGDNAPMALVELVDRPAPAEGARDTGDSSAAA